MVFSESPSPISLGTEENWFSENDETQSDILSDTSFGMVYGPGEASDVAMPYSDVSIMKTSTSVSTEMLGTVLVNSAYPMVKTRQVSHITFSTHEGTQRVANTIIHLLGTPSKDKAVHILSSLSAKFPPSSRVELRWWDTNSDLGSADPNASSGLGVSRHKVTPIDAFADSSLLDCGHWRGFNPHNRSFFDLPDSIIDVNAAVHSIFVLYYSCDSTIDTTELFYRIAETNLIALASDTLLVPIADYLLDPTAALCQKIPVSKRTPLVKIAMKKRSYKVPYTVSQLDAMSLDQLLQKGRGKLELAHRNAVFNFDYGGLLAFVLMLAFSYFGFILSVAAKNDCVQLKRPLTWPGIASKSLWVHNRCTRPPSTLYPTMPPISMAPVSLVPLDDAKSTSELCRKVNTVVDVVIDKTNFVTDHVAQALHVAGKKLVELWQTVATYFSQLETRIKSSARVHHYKQSHGECGASRTHLTTRTTDISAAPTNASPQELLVDETTMLDVVRAHSEPLISSIQHAFDNIKSYHTTQRAMEKFSNVLNTAPQSLAWLTHPKRTWRDDIIHRFGTFSKLCGSKASTLYVDGKGRFKNLKSTVSDSKTAKWIAGMHGRRFELGRASSHVRERARNGYEWVKEKVAAAKPMERK